ncbi:HU family DNA-binding protein [Alloprevotella sp. OH1205_COT-284]|uniref:HU family DNA-binding protein n=1 Tax=Alloprevotella sp. OH1205_COT-284 TaxID=2491043 RepID=UPI000F5E2BC8|nr:HU family DNA-binding protein [Alloprevotella sp. OH1205_COT-284]RRD77014.1 HU family DNA-binding protein [Alloprevotella sp. OH1205_COT-284]
MNNKEFIAALSNRSETTQKETKQLVESLVNVIADALDEGATISIQNFGTFEVKKKNERIIVNPTTRQRQLIPPKLAVAFKPSNALKEKVNPK